jgi:hypothetical protein
MSVLNCSGSSADQAREIGLVVGDTIEGREHHRDGTWNDARIQLVWLGETATVWRGWRRTSSQPEWRYTGEQANWSLDCRKWVRSLTQDE